MSAIINHFVNNNILSDRNPGPISKMQYAAH